MVCTCYEVELPHLRRQDLKNRQNSIDDVAEETADYYQQH